MFFDVSFVLHYLSYVTVAVPLKISTYMATDSVNSTEGMHHVDNKVLWYRSFLSNFQSARPFSKCIFWQTTSKCLIFQINPTPRTSSLINYHIAGKFCWVQIFADRPASTKIKLQKKWTKMEIGDFIMCIHRYKLVPTYICKMPVNL